VNGLPPPLDRAGTMTWRRAGYSWEGSMPLDFSQATTRICTEYGKPFAFPVGLGRAMHCRPSPPRAENALLVHRFGDLPKPPGDPENGNRKDGQQAAWLPCSELGHGAGHGATPQTGRPSFCRLDSSDTLESLCVSSLDRLGWST
jgi:hypothetical protein